MFYPIMIILANSSPFFVEPDCKRVGFNANFAVGFSVNLGAILGGTEVVGMNDMS